MKQNKKIIGCSLIIILLAISIGIGFQMQQSTPEKTVENLEKAINDKNADKILLCFTPSIQKQAKGYLEGVEDATRLPIWSYLKFLPLFQKIGGVDDYPKLEIKILDKTETKEEAVLSVQVFLNAKKEINGEVDMVKRDNNWYIKSARPTGI